MPGLATRRRGHTFVSREENDMVFILPVMAVGQGPAAQPPSIETRAPAAQVAEGAPYAGWRLVAQAGAGSGTSGAGMGTGSGSSGLGTSNSLGAPSSSGSTYGTPGSSGAGLDDTTATPGSSNTATDTGA